MRIWQPIENAPKDGQTIWLWDSHTKHIIKGARWDYHYWLNGRPQGEKDWGKGDRDGPFCYQPTHWMTPIPDPEGPA